MRPIISSRLTRSIIVLLLLSVCVWGGLAYYDSLHFHVVSTTPSTRNVSSIAPFFDINFNRPLSGEGLAITSDPNIIKTYKISGKSIIVSLNASMQLNSIYTITVSHISDLKGDSLSSLVFSFKAQDIPYQDLPKDQQQVLLSRQTVKLNTRNSLTYTGLDSFVNYGLSTSQLEGLKQTLFLFYQTTSKEAYSLSLKGVTAVPHDPNSSSIADTINFTVGLGKTSYSAKLSYIGLNDIELYVYNAAGVQVYDSGLIDGSNL